MIIEKWKNAQTYVIGKYHINNNLACQDRTFYNSEKGVKVISLADGAGSASHSEIGAEIVCKEICALLVNNFTEYLLKFENEEINISKHNICMKELSNDIINHLVTKLKQKALDLNISLKELGSTMLFFAIKGNYYIMGHIGDGVIAGQFSENNSSRVKILSHPENGSASNITYFVTDSDANDRLRLKAGKIDNLTGIIMSSDGASDVLFNANGVDKSTYELFTKFHQRTSAEYENIISEFLSKVISNYSTDDLSLNLLVLEDVDASTVTEEYADYLLEDITSSNQIIRKSQYCYFLDPSITGNYEFKHPVEVKRYLGWS